MREIVRRNADAQQKATSRRKCLRGFALMVIVLVASLPLMVNYCIEGINVSFYLRLFAEGGEENLYYLLPSVLVKLGVSLEAAYMLMLFLVNAVTALIAYASFGKMFGSHSIGLLGSMIYTWIPYRLNDMYIRADLGEAVAIAFLPMLCYGLYRLFVQEGQSDYGKLWLLLTVAYSLIFHAYLLTFVVSVGVTLLLCVVQWRKTKRKATLLVLLKSALVFGIGNSWAIGLLLYRVMNGQFPFGIVGNGKIQSRGMYLSNFLQLFFKSGTSYDVAEEGMRGMQPYGFGFVVTFGLLVYLGLGFVGRYREKEEKRELLQFVKCLTGIGSVLAIMCTNSFPWDALQKGRLLYGAVACLYEPTRLMPFVAVFATVAVCAATWQVKRWESRDVARIFGITLIVTAFLTTQYLTGDILRNGLPRNLGADTRVEEITEAECQLVLLDMSPLDYARYEGSRFPAPKLLYAAEAVLTAGGIVFVVLAWRKKRVEKI